MALEAAAVRREGTAMAGVRLHVPEGWTPGDRPGDAPGGAGAGALGGAGGETDPKRLTEALLDRALGLGCAAAGVFSLDSFSEGGRRVAEWLATGRHGTMGYLAEGDRSTPGDLLPGGRSGLVIAVPYATDAGALLSAPARGGSLTDAAVADAAVDAAAFRGKVAKYAQGDDYHHQLRMLLLELADLCAVELGRPVLARVCVDTAPLLERDAAQRAGLSFFGKNTLAIVPGVGSYFLLGELLVDVGLAPGVRVRGRRRREVPRAGCGACRACLDACPTGAFLGEHAIDARRCISYLTIEYDGVIPDELRRGIGAHAFGCDICQDVCPFNQSAHKRGDASPLGHQPHLNAPDLVELLELTSSSYRRFVAGTALRRVNRARLARNAAVALGNVGDERALLPLARALSRHPSALVRGHSAWALGQVLQRVASSPEARPSADPCVSAIEALRDAAEHDDERWVRAEARQALLGAEEGPKPRRLPLLRQS